MNNQLKRCVLHDIRAWNEATSSVQMCLNALDAVDRYDDDGAGLSEYLELYETMIAKKIGLIDINLAILLGKIIEPLKLAVPIQDHFFSLSAESDPNEIDAGSFFDLTDTFNEFRNLWKGEFNEGRGKEEKAEILIQLICLLFEAVKANNAFTSRLDDVRKHYTTSKNDAAEVELKRLLARRIGEPDARPNQNDPFDELQRRDAPNIA